MIHPVGEGGSRGEGRSLSPPLQEQQREAGEEAREGAGGLAPQHIFDVFCFRWAAGSSALPRPVPARVQAGPQQRRCC